MIITEQQLRIQLKNHVSDHYILPKDGVLTPSARDYINQKRLTIVKAKEDNANNGEQPQAEAINGMPQANAQDIQQLPVKPKYKDTDTGAFYFQKPEHMTQLSGNNLVAKNHPRIVFRGKIDSLNAMIVLAQVLIAEEGKTPRILDDLDDISRQLGEVMRADVMDEPCEGSHIIGLDHAQLRDRSHHPMKYFEIKQLLIANYSMGKTYALLNQIRAGIREAEVMAVSAFQVANQHLRPDIIQHLNRLSSALHIMSCMYLAGMYDEKSKK